MVWYGMVEVCEGAPVAVSGWVLTDGVSFHLQCINFESSSLQTAVCVGQ